MTEIYCSLEEAYGTDFTKNIDTKKSLSNTKIYNKENNNFKTLDSNYKPKKTPNNNFDTSSKNESKLNVTNNNINYNDKYLENTYNSNHSLLMKILNDNKKLHEKLDKLNNLNYSSNNYNSLSDIFLYIITGILVILLIDMVINRISKIKLMV